LLTDFLLRRGNALRRWLTIGVSSALTALAVGGCGGGGGGGRATLNWYVFPEPSGSFAKAAADCSQASGGRYTVSVQTLPSDADSQRQQLVRRLAAKDSSIDIVGMDVVWTAEFAEAGWLRPWTGSAAQEVSSGTLAVPIATATYKGKLYGAPANSNTQLLWYRKDLVPNPPTTWDQMIAMAEQLAKAGKPHLIEIQGKQYEGYMVWFNTLVNSAGGQILSGPSTVAIGPPAEVAASVIKKLATSPAADPSLSNQQEDQNRLAFEKGVAPFELNYPFVYPSAQKNAPQIFKQMGWARWPGVQGSQPSKVTIGGLNLGVSSYSKHPAEAFAAAACVRNSEHQKIAAIKGGLPPTITALYDDPALASTYPFHELIKQQLQDASIRPQTPAYSDVSLAITKALSPPNAVKPGSIIHSLAGQLKKALGSGALL
jgi:multiple sugar transport system substrate-binding protein